MADAPDLSLFHSTDLENRLKAMAATKLNPTLNTSGWSTNSSTAFRAGNMIFINIYVIGTPAANKNIMSGLPKPDQNSNISFIIPSSLGNSTGAVRYAYGDVIVASPGTTSTGYFGAFVAYKTKE